MAMPPEDYAGGTPNDPSGTPPIAPMPPTGMDINKDARMWAMLCHLSGFAAYTGIPLANVLAPLIIWQIKKEENPFIDDQGKEALNFQISFTIYAIVCILLMFCVIGIPLAIVLGIAQIILMIIAAIKSNNGEVYRYPLTIRII